MNKQEIEIVRGNWEAVRPNARFVARLFYTRLLLIDPSLSPLFRRDSEEQSQRLLRAVAIAVHGIGQPRILLPLLRMLGRHPAVRRMPASQFESIGQAMLWTLRIALGDDFDKPAQRAWDNLCRMVSRTLREARREAVGIVVTELRAAA
jgi:hemoglobin-like flavoprotein